jgi:hypothetical protein
MAQKDQQSRHENQGGILEGFLDLGSEHANGMGHSLDQHEKSKQAEQRSK